MAVIVTVTLNPAIDKSISIRQLIPEKKLRSNMPVLEPGGGGINVARVIKKLGGEVTAIFPGGGYNGSLLQQLLSADQIHHKMILIQQDVRENLIVYEETTRRQYRFCMPGPTLSEKEWKQCLQEIRQITQLSFLVASGSLPPGVPPAIFADMAALAKEKNAKFIADTSGAALQAVAAEGAYLLKPNIGELASLAGKEELNPEAIADTAREIISKGRCEIMIVSMGAAGAMLVTSELVRQIIPPPVRIKSTVGAGDSMVAGIVWQLSLGTDLPEAVRYGVACGTAATMNPGTELCKPEDVNRLYKIMQP